MADADTPRVSVGDVPEHLQGGGDVAHLDRDDHILIRRQSPPMPSEDELDDGPDRDPETGELRPATYKLNSGNVRRDF